MDHGPFDARRAPDALTRILAEHGPDAAVTIDVVPALLTVGQVADVLGSSRRHVARLIDDGTLPAEFHGLHRRVARADVLTVAREQARARTEVLDALADMSRREGLYDEF